jgi:hypothetical protein
LIRSDGTLPSASSQNPPEQSTFLKLYHERQSQKQKRIEELSKRNGEENKNGENQESLDNKENQSKGRHHGLESESVDFPRISS